MRIHFYPELASTNTTAFELALTGAGEGEVVLADAQSRGRGRLDRAWHSPPEKNLYLSIILRPPLPVSAAAQLTPAAGLAVAEVLSRYCPGRVRIKWPNDVQIGGRKIAGILTEMKAAATAIDFVVLGIGINVNMAREDFPAELTNLATSLKIETGQVYCRLSLVSQLMATWGKWYQVVITSGFRGIKEPFLSYAPMKGKALKVTNHGEVCSGIMVDLDDTGTMLIRDETGAIRRIKAGDVTFEGS